MPQSRGHVSGHTASDEVIQEAQSLSPCSLTLFKVFRELSMQLGAENLGLNRKAMNLAIRNWKFKNLDSGDHWMLRPHQIAIKVFKQTSIGLLNILYIAFV